MATTTATRRTLTFDTLDQVMPEVDRLLAGHTTAGRWSLGQVCNHLTATFTGSVDGFPARAPWLVRKAIAPFALRRVMRTGRIPEGRPLPKKYHPKPGLDDRAEAEALRAALRMFAGHSGPVAEHPFFGRIDRAQWDRLHCIHCAHHLSFAHPAG